MENSTPQPWPIVTIGHMEQQRWLEIRNGFAEGGFNESGVGVPQLRPFNVGVNGTIDMGKVKYVPAPPLGSPRWLRPGDVVFNNTNSEDLTGKTAIFNRAEPCTLSNHMTMLRVTDDGHLDAGWLACSLYSLWRAGRFRLMLRRYVGQATVSLTHLRALQLAVPPVDEQRAIAHTLRIVQQTLEATEQLVGAARELQRSLREHLFRDCREAVGDERRDEAGGHVNGTTSTTWGIQPLSDLLREPLRNGKSAPPTNGDHGVRTLTLSAVTLNDFSLKNTKLTELDASTVTGLWLEPGDIFIERANTRALVGTAALYEGPGKFAIYPDLLIRVRPDTNRVDPKFLVEWLRTTAVRRLLSSSATGTAASMPKIGHGLVARIPIPVPPLSEQLAIVAVMRAADRKVDVELSYRDALTNLFRTLLKDLMSTRLRVHEADVPVAPS